MSAKRATGIILAVGLAFVVIRGMVNAPSASTATAPLAVQYPESAATYA